MKTYQLARLDERWIKQEKLGSGTYAKVFLASPAADQQCAHVALKQYRDTSYGAEGLSAALVRELALMARHQHPNLVALLEVCYCKRQTYAVLEYMPLTVEDLVDDGEPVIRPWTDVAPVLTHLMRALQHLHSWDVVHRDVASGNVFLSSRDLRTCTVKLGDLNLSRMVARDMTPGMG